MKYINKSLQLWAVALLIGLVACQQPTESAATEESEATTEMAENDDAAATEETEHMEEEEDKSKRPSPPATSTGSIAGAQVTVNYGAPSVKERTIWGDLVPYGKVWRTGANEATTIEVDKDVMINGEKLPAGKYALFTVPTESAWTIVFNSNADQWGAYEHDEALDVLKIQAEPVASEEMMEQLQINVNEEAGNVAISWEHLTVAFSVAQAG